MGMKIETMMRHFREAYRGVRRNSWMSFAAVSAVAVTLFIFGLFLITAFNVRYMAGELEKQVAIRAALSPSMTGAQERQLTEQIQQLPGVKNATLIPKNVGLRQMRDEWGPGGEQLFKDLDGEGQNPLPDIITVEPTDPKNVESLKKQIENFGSDKIERVEAGEGVTDKLLNFSSMLRNIVLIFGLGLAVLAAFLISNTIKLTIIARQREIEIQRLVGASNWFIRWPFFIEGAFIGLVGAIFPVVIVLTIYQVFYNVLGAGEAAAILKLMPVVSLGIYVTISIFALGVAIGTIGSIISVRRFLKV
jgi:cell division transport system permease protein